MDGGQVWRMQRDSLAAWVKRRRVDGAQTDGAVFGYLL